MTNEIETYVNRVLVLNDSAKKEIDALVFRGNEITQVTNDSEARTAGNFVRDVKSLIKVADDERKKYTRVLDSAKKRIMFEADKQLIGLRTTLKRVGDLAEAYVEQQKAEAEAAQQTAIEEASVAAEFGEEVLPPTAESGRVGGVRSRESWSFEVANADEVPRQYCSPDAVLINGYIKEARANGTSFNDLFIPGLRFVKHTTVY